MRSISCGPASGLPNQIRLALPSMQNKFNTDGVIFSSKHCTTALNASITCTWKQSKKVKCFIRHIGPQSSTDLSFDSDQPNTGLHYEATDQISIPRSMSIYSSAFSLVLMHLLKVGWPGWVDLCGWLNSKMVQMRIEPANLLTWPGRERVCRLRKMVTTKTNDCLYLKTLILFCN